MKLGKLIASWPVVRQLDGDALGLGRAAESQATANLAPRTRNARRVVKSVCPYGAVGCQGKSGHYLKLAKGLTVTGAGVLALAGRSRAGALAGGALLLAGGAFARWGIFRAGFASARDPKYTVVPQRERLEART